RESEPVAIWCRRVSPSRKPPELGRRPAVGTADLAVEPPQAAEAGSDRNLVEWQRGLVGELFCEVHAARQRDLERRRAEMVDEEAAEMARGHAESIGEPIDVAVLDLARSTERAFADETQRPRHETGCPEPGGRSRRRLGTTPETGTEAGRFSGSGGRIVADV